eukprot:scaffold12506_cov64-Skeletonema_dohrnii-CCMP3373.AAC.1
MMPTSAMRQGRFDSGSSSGATHQQQQEITSPSQVTFQPGAAPPQPTTTTANNNFNSPHSLGANFMFDDIEDFQHYQQQHHHIFPPLQTTNDSFPHSPQQSNNNTTNTGALPTEAQLTLLCLDYLRSLRRSYQNPQDLFHGEGLHADYISLAVWSLSRAFVSPEKLAFGEPKVSKIMEEGDDNGRRKNKKKKGKEIQLVGGGGLAGVEDECVGNDSFYRMVVKNQQQKGDDSTTMMNNNNGIGNSTNDILPTRCSSLTVATPAAENSTDTETQTSTAAGPVANPAAVSAVTPMTVPTAAAAAANPTAAATANVAGPSTEDKLKDRIKELKQKALDCTKAIEPFEKALKSITNKVEKAKKYRKSINEKIDEFKKSRKSSGDGVESEMFTVLKSFGIELQAYHGGSILKKNRKVGCEYDESQIDAICQRFAKLCVLWDGAFSYASKIDPTKDDILMYERFVTAAVHLHVELGLNVTPKVHLMWKHVVMQMMLDGGLYHKREDWVERQHQETSRERNHFKHTKDMEVRCTSMARLRQQETDPDVVAWGAKVDAKACRGPRKKYTTKEEERKKERQTRRLAVLNEWETNNPDKKHKVQSNEVTGVM